MSAVTIVFSKNNLNWVQDLFCPTVKTTEIKLNDFQALYTISEHSLNNILDSKGLKIKIADGVQPELVARIFRVLAGKLDNARHQRSRSFDGYAW